MNTLFLLTELQLLLIPTVLVGVLFLIFEFYTQPVWKKVTLTEVAVFSFPVEMRHHFVSLAANDSEARRIPFMYSVVFPYQGRPHHAFFFHLDPEMKEGKEVWVRVRRHGISRFLYIQKIGIEKGK